MITQFIELITETLEKEESSIDKNDDFRQYEEWDSLAILSIIAMIKQNYDITIPRKDFESLKTVEELFDYITRHRK